MSTALPPLRLRRELLYALAIKLAFVYAIKLIFFSHPMDKAARAQAVADRLLAQPAASASSVPPLKEFHDQRTTR